MGHTRLSPTHAAEVLDALYYTMLVVCEGWVTSFLGILMGILAIERTLGIRTKRQHFGHFEMLVGIFCLVSSLRYHCASDILAVLDSHFMTALFNHTHRSYYKRTVYLLDDHKVTLISIIFFMRITILPR